MVELTFDTVDNDFWCAARTDNGRNQTMSITGYSHGTLSLFIFDYGWKLAKRKVDFKIDIDYSRWSVTGDADGIGVSAKMGNNEKSVEFLSELSQGSAVAVLTSDLDRLATFSLSGSSAALRSFMQCWVKINDRDPFKSSSSDPFGASKDPF